MLKRDEDVKIKERRKIVMIEREKKINMVKMRNM